MTEKFDRLAATATADFDGVWVHDDPLALLALYWALALHDLDLRGGGQIRHGCEEETKRK